MKKTTAVIVVLCALVVGFATYNRTNETKVVPSTSTPEVSDAVSTSAEPVAEPVSTVPEAQTTFRAEGTVGVSME